MIGLPEDMMKIAEDIYTRYGDEMEAIRKTYPEIMDFAVGFNPTRIFVKLAEGSTADAKDIPSSIGKEKIPVVVYYQNKMQDQIQDRINAAMDDNEAEITRIFKAHPGATITTDFNKASNSPELTVYLPEGSKEDASDIPPTVGDKKIPVKVVRGPLPPSSCKIR